MPKARIIEGWYFTSDGRLSHFTEKELYVATNWLQRRSLPDVDEALVDLLEAVRYEIKQGLTVTSGVRSNGANEAAGGDDMSLHLSGGAADVKSDGLFGWRWVPILERVTKGASLGRWGIYSSRDAAHAHLDIDRERPRRSFVVEGGTYTDANVWVKKHFPKKTILTVDPKLANKVLGF